MCLVSYLNSAVQIMRSWSCK